MKQSNAGKLQGEKIKAALKTGRGWRRWMSRRVDGAGT